MQQNAVILKRAIEALNVGDRDALTELFAENAQWHTPGKSVFAGGHIGIDPILRQFDRYAERAEGPSIENCSSWLLTTEAAHWGSIAASENETTSSWTWSVARWSKSGTDVSLMGNNTSSTSTPGTSSGLKV
jgi:hypothetical protein